MKKYLMVALVVALAAGVSSCAKTNKRKLNGAWTVSSEKISEDNSSDGMVDIETFTANGANGSVSVTYGPSGSATVYNADADILLNEFKIRKDGTWTRNRTYRVNDDNSYMQHNFASSGTWAFAKKSKGEDYGRNGRVMFCVLMETSLVVQHTSDPDLELVQKKTSDTYVSGERVLTYEVVSSSRKQLKLKAEGNHLFTDESGTPAFVGQSATSEELTLEE